MCCSLQRYRVPGSALFCCLLLQADLVYSVDPVPSFLLWDELHKGWVRGLFFLLPTEPRGSHPLYRLPFYGSRTYFRYERGLQAPPSHPPDLAHL